LIQIINSYCGYEAGVRNLRKCIDRIYRKVVAKLEMRKIEEKEAKDTEVAEAMISEHKHYQVNTKNLERFLDVAPTDDNYFINIDKQLPKGCSNGLAYVDDGYGSVLKIQFVKKEY